MRVERGNGGGGKETKSQVKLSTMLLTQEEAKQKGEKVLGRMENGYRPEEIALNHMWFLTAFRNQRY